ncbi:MAG TPA: DUF1343 domain-containing protein [Bryocella sp.]|nr:DUF1343 domain-containing protein [Bryocella sp.]
MLTTNWICGGILALGLCGQAQVPTQPPVLNGIDVLESDHFAALKTLAARHGGHLRAALMTDQAGMDNHDRRTIDVLYSDATAAVPGFKLVDLFSPEHGINGVLDQHSIGNDHDAATGLQVISLFGATDAQRRPSKEQLTGLDAVLIDLQDAGVHYYTYESVVGRFLEAVAGTDVDVVVLDRPNPIGGLAVEGVVSSPGRESYINFISEPVRQGMTMGELATYFKATRHLDSHLTVVQMRGWKRADWFDATGQLWINPSPNLRSLTQAILYPGIGILERTNLSVGRGTDTPFEWVGAPWMDGRVAAAYLNARHIPGVRFIPVQFTPGGAYPFHGQLCKGIEFLVTDRDVLDSPELGLEVASALYKLFPETFLIDKIDQLLLNQTAVHALKAGEDPRKVTQDDRNALEAFKRGRAAALLYK